MIPLVDGPRGGRAWFLPFAVLLGATALLYGHTLSVPFYLDDHPALVGNPLLRDLGATFRNIFSQRGLTNLTFAINYRLSGWGLAPLHLVNIALHAGCGLLVWLLLRRLVAGRGVALAGALLFVAHPLQSQAVTYLIQRSTVLAALFFLLAMLMYLRARTVLAAGAPRSSGAYLVPYLGAVAAGACAVLSKENTVTLPLVLVVYDRLFPAAEERSRRQAILDYLPFFVAPFLLGGMACHTLLLSGDGLALGSEQLSLRHNGPLHYLVTQLSVIWSYFRLLLLPYGQALLHNYPVVTNFFAWQNFLALTGLLGLGGLLWRVRGSRPLLAFGSAWFFLCLAVESSIIPLDPLFEHRLYLPMVGFVLVLIDGLSVLLRTRIVLALLGIALIGAAPLTWQRNALWQDPLAFYLDNSRVAPDSERVFEYLGVACAEAGDLSGALVHLTRAAELNPEDASIYTNLGVIHAWRGDDRQASAYFERSLELAPKSEKTLFNYASVLFNLGEQQRALAALRSVVGINPANAEAQYGLGSLAIALGSRGEAVAARDALRALGDARAHDLEELLSK